MKKLIVFLLLTACATNPGFTDQPMTRLSPRVEYSIAEDATGYTLTVLYTRYHFVFPGEQAVINEATGEFFAVPDMIRAKKATPPDPAKLRSFTDYNPLTGIAYCTLQGRFIY